MSLSKDKFFFKGVSVLSVQLIENPRIRKALTFLHPHQNVIAKVAACFSVVFQFGNFVKVCNGISVFKTNYGILEIIVCAYRSVANSVQIVFDYAKFVNGKMATFDGRISGLAHFRNAIAEESPVVVYAAHTGPMFNAFLCREIINEIGGRKIVILAPKDGQSRKKDAEISLSKMYGDGNIDIIAIDDPKVGIKLARSFKERKIIVCTLDVSFPYTRNEVVTYLGNPFFVPVGVIDIGIKFGSIFIGCMPFCSKSSVLCKFSTPIRNEHNVGKYIFIERLLLPFEAELMKNPHLYTLWGWFYDLQCAIRRGL